MGHNTVVLGYPKSTGIPQVDELSTGPPVLGSHKACGGTLEICCPQKTHDLLIK